MRTQLVLFFVVVVGLFNRAHFCPCKSQSCIYTMWALKLPAFPWEKESPSFCYAEALCYVATLFHVGEMPFYTPPLYTTSTSHTAKTAAVWNTHICLPQRLLIPSQMSSERTVEKKMSCPGKENPFLALISFCPGSTFPVSVVWTLALLCSDYFLVWKLVIQWAQEGITVSTSLCVKWDVKLWFTEIRSLRVLAWPP